MSYGANHLTSYAQTPVLGSALNPTTIFLPDRAVIATAGFPGTFPACIDGRDEGAVVGGTIVRWMSAPIANGDPSVGTATPQKSTSPSIGAVLPGRTSFDSGSALPMAGDVGPSRGDLGQADTSARLDGYLFSTKWLF